MRGPRAGKARTEGGAVAARGGGEEERLLSGCRVPVLHDKESSGNG